jgi:hypothetical protein
LLTSNELAQWAQVLKHDYVDRFSLATKPPDFSTNRNTAKAIAASQEMTSTDFVEWFKQHGTVDGYY